MAEIQNNGFRIARLNTQNEFVICKAKDSGYALASSIEANEVQQKTDRGLS